MAIENICTNDNKGGNKGDEYSLKYDANDIAEWGGEPRKAVTYN